MMATPKDRESREYLEQVSKEAQAFFDMDSRTLGQRINAIQVECANVPKTGWNKHFKYWFTKKSDMLNAVNASMAKNGVVCSKLSLRIESVAGDLITVKVVAQLRLATDRDDSGQVFEYEGLGSGKDSQDKGVAKAESMAVKYLWANAFHTSFGDREEDPEDDSHDDARVDETPGQRQHAAPAKREDARPSPAAKPPAAATKQKSQQEAELIPVPKIVPGQHNRNMTIGFGPDATLPLKDMSHESIEKAIAMVKALYVKPSQKNYQKQNANRLATLAAEVAYRKASAGGYDPATGDVLGDDKLPPGY